MKINDTVFLIYGPECSVLQVKLLSEFAKSSDRIYGNTLGCRAQFLKRYDFKNGWQPYQDHHFEKTHAIYRVRKSTLYATWEEARAVLASNLEKKIEADILYTEQKQREIKKCQENLEKELVLIHELRNFDLRKHFTLDDNKKIQPENYVSPFTGKII